MSNDFIKDPIKGERRIYYYYVPESLARNSRFRRKDRKEQTIAYALDMDIKSIYQWVLKRFSADVFDGELAVTISVGVAIRNPKDTPNRKVAKRLARMRLKFKPTDRFEFSVTSVNLYNDVVYFKLNRTRYGREEITFPSCLKISYDKSKDINDPTAIKLNIFKQEDYY